MYVAYYDDDDPMTEYLPRALPTITMDATILPTLYQHDGWGSDDTPTRPSRWGCLYIGYRNFIVWTHCRYLYCTYNFLLMYSHDNIFVSFSMVF